MNKATIAWEKHKGKQMKKRIAANRTARKTRKAQRRAQ